jgi:uncharacterized protein YutE (UPF0331/DUF86 family)
MDERILDHLVEMAKFRNRLVHAYWDLDKEAVYEFLQRSTEDLQLFQKKTIEFLNTNSSR